MKKVERKRGGKSEQSKKKEKKNKRRKPRRERRGVNANPKKGGGLLLKGTERGGWE